MCHFASKMAKITILINVQKMIGAHNVVGQFGLER